MTAMLMHTGLNSLDGVPVEVTRKRVRRINLRIARDGRVLLSYPAWGCTLAEAEAFLRSKWKWVVETRRVVAARPDASRAPVTPDERAALVALLAERHAAWVARTGETCVIWKLRRMTSVWGSCHWRKRVITYSTELARKAPELVDYVVAHEFAHFRVHDHGPAFRALMDERLPGWRELRQRLNSGEKNGETEHVRNEP